MCCCSFASSCSSRLRLRLLAWAMLLPAVGELLLRGRPPLADGTAPPLVELGMAAELRPLREGELLMATATCQDGFVGSSTIQLPDGGIA
jgi:hypothetical protein